MTVETAKTYLVLDKYFMFQPGYYNTYEDQSNIMRGVFDTFSSDRLFNQGLTQIICNEQPVNDESIDKVMKRLEQVLYEMMCELSTQSKIPMFLKEKSTKHFS